MSGKLNQFKLMTMKNFTNFITDFSKVKTLGKVISLLLVLSTISSYGQSNCPLACNNLVQVSLDGNCEAEITPDMILEAPGAGCTYIVTVLGPNNQPIPTSPVVNGNHIGMTLNVRVNLGANSCWGSIIIKDKLPPVIECPEGYLVECYSDFDPPLPDAFDNCGVPTVKIISDRLLDENCNANYSAVRTIQYQAEDGSGNLSEICEVNVYYERIGLADISFPPNYDDLQNPSLNCNNIPFWDRNNNGYPDVNETGAPFTTEGGFPIFPDVKYCELNVTFSDHVIDVCPGTFKVLRTWTVLDWCTAQIRQHIQIIKVADNQGPIIACPDEMTIEANPYTCTSDWQAPAPTVIFDCSNTTYTVAFLLAGPGENCSNPPTSGLYVQQHGNVRVEGNSTTGYTIRNLPLGCTWVRYTVTDECGNSTFCFTEIEVVDNVPPFPVCVEFTVATLTSNGWARIFAHSFDNGSFDNCCDVSFEVRRMTPGCNQNTTTFGPFVDFCCDDVGKDIMVELRVSDCNDNSNTCMVIARIHDKSPLIINCPNDVTVDCRADFDNLNQWGSATATALCTNLTPTYTDGPGLNECGLGTFLRTWSVQRGSEVVTCNQRFTVRDFDPFTSSDILWPAHRELEGCMNVDSDPTVTGRPTWNHKECSLIAATFNDQVFTFVDGACFKILRTWTVIDWCTFNQSNPQAGGLWQYTQTIKLHNTTAPVFENCGPREFCVFGENCDGFVDLRKEASDDCTPSNQLKWSYIVFANNGSVPTFTGSTNNAGRVYPVGTHRVQWRVEDGCGNVNTCTEIFTVNDCKKPTPYCIGEITTVLMPTTGEIDVWASDFDLGSFDNCPGTLRFSFSSNVNDNVRIFTCADLGINTLQMWVTDVAGNQEFCNVRINIQSNGNCGSRVAGGRVETPDHQALGDLRVNFTHLNNGEVLKVQTNENGRYQIEALPEASFNISVESTEDYLNGVTTLDLVLIQRHILGHESFDSPLQLIAADADNNGQISASDLVEIRRLILGAIEKYSSNNSWRFVDKTQMIEGDDNPWPLPELIQLDFDGTESLNNHFTGVKVGDVNFTAKPDNFRGGDLQSRSAKSLALSFENQVVLAGSEIEIPISSADFNNIFGFQFTMNLNAEIVEFTDIVSGAIDIDQNNLGFAHYGNNAITLSWHSADAISADNDEALFSIILRAKADTELTQILNISSEHLRAEAYDENLDILNVILESRNSEGEAFELMQNTPNPFSETTFVRFVLPESGMVNISVFDITGKVVSFMRSEFPQGLNELRFNSDEIGAPGVYFYQVESNGHRETKKMILINK
jgi:hypothetical protein